jgi:hypothetical protein
MKKIVKAALVLIAALGAGSAFADCYQSYNQWYCRGNDGYFYPSTRAVAVAGWKPARAVSVASSGYGRPRTVAVAVAGSARAVAVSRGN